MGCCRRFKTSIATAAAISPPPGRLRLFYGVRCWSHADHSCEDSTVSRGSTGTHWPMIEISVQLSKLVPLSGATFTAKRRRNLLALVESGAVALYVRVPAGKTVYRDAGIQRLAATITEAHSAPRQSLPAFELARAREAEHAGTPLIRDPLVIPDAAYVGLAATDARRLLALQPERIDVHWFHSAVLIPPRSETGAQQLHRVVPRGSPCCLRPDDGKPMRGPWIGHNREHALTIALSDVYVDANALRDPIASVEDPLDLQDTAPGVYVLCRVAAQFNDPKKGVTLSKEAVEEAVKNEAKNYDIPDWLFNIDVLRQVRKLINRHHSETQGTKDIAKLRLDVIAEDVAALHAKHHWISGRIALLIHAARHWQHLIRKEGRVWDAMETKEKIALAGQFGGLLRDWGFTSDREWSAAFLIAAYPDDLRSTKTASRKKLPKTRA